MQEAETQIMNARRSLEKREDECERKYEEIKQHLSNVRDYENEVNDKDKTLDDFIEKKAREITAEYRNDLERQSYNTNLKLQEEYTKKNKSLQKKYNLKENKYNALLLGVLVYSVMVTFLEAVQSDILMHHLENSLIWIYDKFIVLGEVFLPIDAFRRMILAKIPNQVLAVLVHSLISLIICWIYSSPVMCLTCILYTISAGIKAIILDKWTLAVSVFLLGAMICGMDIITTYVNINIVVLYIALMTIYCRIKVYFYQNEIQFEKIQPLKPLAKLFLGTLIFQFFIRILVYQCYFYY